MKLNALLLDPAVLGDDAWRYLERICGMLPDLGVVVCTGRSTVAQRVRGLRLGVDDWITKPCHPEEAIARIEAVARRRRRGRHERRVRAAGRRRAGDPPRPVPGLRRRREPRPDPARVRAAAPARRRQGPGARARDDLPAGLGLRDGPRRSLGRRLHPQAAPEAGEALARLGLHPHPLRGRLPLRPGAGAAATRCSPAPSRSRPAAASAREPGTDAAQFTSRSQELHRDVTAAAAAGACSAAMAAGAAPIRSRRRLEIRPEEHAALVDGRPLSLTMRELQLLRHPRLESAADHDPRGALRRGLGQRAAPRRPLGRRLRQPPARQARRRAAGHTLIHTHNGIGYRFSPDGLASGSSPFTSFSHPRYSQVTSFLRAADSVAASSARSRAPFVSSQTNKRRLDVQL